VTRQGIESANADVRVPTRPVGSGIGTVDLTAPQLAPRMLTEPSVFADVQHLDNGHGTSDDALAQDEVTIDPDPAPRMKEFGRAVHE
jgi:hypothetical protein